MNRTNNFSRAGLAGLAIGLLGVSASAQFISREPMSTVRTQPGQAGWGGGTIRLATTSSMGMLTGALADGQASGRYTFDAKLTIFIPAGGLVGEGFHSGGLYGYIQEVPLGGMLEESTPLFLGYVEGLWRTEKDDSGTFLAFVYRRSVVGSSQLSGVITGRIYPPEGGIPQPTGERLDATALGSVGERQPRKQGALQDAAWRRDSFEDAVNGKKSTGGATGKEPEGLPGSPKQAFKSAASNRFDTPSGPIVDDSYRVGTFKARYKLLD